MERKQTVRGRFYETPDGTFPSVTTILGVIGKPALINWAAKVEREIVMDVAANLYEDVHGTPKMSRIAWLGTLQTRLGKTKEHQRQLAKAGEIGTQTHALIEWTLRARLCQQPGPSPRISDKAQWAFMVFEDWAKKVNLKPVLIEQQVWSAVHGFAGTMDLLAEIDGELTVVDFKTGKKVYQEAHLQNAAYRVALREMGHGDATRGVIVRLPKDETDPEPDAVEAGRLPSGQVAGELELFSAFMSAKRVWEYVQIMDEWAANQEAKSDKSVDYSPKLEESLRKTA